MADRTKIRSVTVRDLGTKNTSEIAAEKIFNARLRQLSALRVYHQNKIKDLDEELARLLKNDVDGIDY